jgi:hypothetical protein
MMRRVQRKRTPEFAERERPRVAEPPARPPAQPVRGAALSVAAFAGLQARAGNAAVSRLLARQPTATVVSPAREAYDKARVERDKFAKSAKKPAQTYNPSTRNADNYYGGFDVEYDPGKEELLVTLKGAVLFLPGITLGADGRAVASETSAQTTAAVDVINKMAAAARPAAVLQWQWTTAGGPDANDEQDFLDNFKSSVESTWRKQHPFHCTRQYWEDIGATTEIKVEIAKVAAATDKTGTQHMLVNAHKVPKNFVGGDADVSRPAGKAAGAFGNVMNVTSEDAGKRHDDMLRRNVSFQHGKGLLTPPSVGTVWRLAKEMPNPKPGSTIETAGLTAHVQGRDAGQRADRFEAVLDHLKQGGGVDPARVKFEDGGEGDGGQLTVGDGKRQTVVAHESGHMFGLDDEYTGPDAYGPGKKTEHTDLAAAAGETGAMHALSDSVMSGGSKVRPHHYVTFLDALKVVTNIPEWTYGAKQVVNPPNESGDFPLPPKTDADGNGTAVA